MSDGEEGRSSGTSESNMMEMVRMIMEENRQNEIAREKKRDKKEKEDAKKLHERQMEFEEMRQKGLEELEEKKLKGLRELEEAKQKRQEEIEEMRQKGLREAEEAKRKREEEAEKARREAEEAKRKREEEAEEARQKGIREAEEWRQRRQEEYDAKQLEQQMNLMRAQVELTEKTSKLQRESQDLERRRSRALTGIAEWKEGEDLEEFFESAERKMTAADIRGEEWIEIIDQKLKGQALLAWQNAVGGGGGYSEVKGRVLEVCGYTPEMAAESFFEAKTEQCRGLTASQLLYKGKQMFRRMVAPEKPSPGMEFLVMKGWMKHVVPRGAKRVLGIMPVGTESELIAALQHYLGTEGDCKVGQAPTFRLEGTSQVERPRERYGSQVDRPRDRFGPLICFKCGKNGHKAADCWQGSGAGQPRPLVGENLGNRINCFTCGVEGHKSPQCPKNIKGAQGPQIERAKPVMRIGTDRARTQQVKGVVNGIDTQIVLDSGAGITLVPEGMVSNNQLTGRTVAVRPFWATRRLRLPIARLSFEVGGEAWTEAVGVVPRKEGVEEEVIYSLNLRSDRGKFLVQQLGGGHTVEVRRVITRAEERKLQQEAEEDRLELAVCSPVVSPLPSGREVRNDPEAGVQTVEEEEMEEAEVRLAVEGTENTTRDLELDIPVLKKGKGSREELVKETGSDPSLKRWREMAEKGEGGFMWKKGLLHQEVMSQVLEKGLVLVLPKAFRHRVLEMSHDKMQHMGARRVTQLVKKRFTWPGVGKDIINFCRACPTCQRCDKRKGRQALMMERPVMSEPFEVIGVDLVGPFKVGKGGCTHLLTVICMATRWPEAIPLKSITARAVATGLLEIFSRIGIPRQIVSDQGAQFTGSVLRHVCQGLHIESITTTPYHPEGNGVVERMHGPLCAMLKKAVREGNDWVSQVPFALFALRAAPNRDTNFSPFELVYGKRVRTPLDVIHQGWCEDEFEDLDCGEWADWLVSKLECWHELMRERGVEASRKRKENFDRKAVCRELEVGDLVLIRIPGLTAKLEESWKGPFPVIKKYNRVNYGIETSKGRTAVRHINNLKRFWEREVEVLRLSVVAEEFGGDESNGVRLQGAGEGFDEKKWSDLKNEFGDVFTDVPGRTGVCKLEIKTGEAQPIASCPHRVPDRLKESVRMEVAKLMEMGVVVESTSPWASPIVPVVKEDGTVRLCVDYRRLNGISQGDPYYMATLEEILERVGSSSCISKLDLSCGFHQIEVEEESRQKTAFITPYGKFEFLRMPFGLRNAPSVFQRAMEVVLRGCYSFCAPYIDDLVVFSQSGKEHLGHLREVLETLRRNGLTVKLGKCEFGRRRLEYLGHLIGGGEMAVPAHRATAMAEYIQPRTKKDMRAFLGMASYYRRFVKGFSSYSSLLSPSTAKLAPGVVVWTGEMLKAFHGLKVSLVNVCALTVPSLEDCFVLHTDASGAGVGAALYVLREGKELPVGFFSRQLQGAQCRYSATELEALAVFQAVHFFAHYLWGTEFTVVTDHRALVHLMTSKKLNKRLTGWALQLMDFNFSILYKPGKLHQDADGLSRQGWDRLEEETETEWSDETAEDVCNRSWGRCGDEPHTEPGWTTVRPRRHKRQTVEPGQGPEGL